MNIFEKIRNFFKNLFVLEPVEQYKVEENNDKFKYYTLDAVLNAYIASCSGNKSEATIKGYKNICRNYFETIRGIETCYLTPDAIQKALDLEIEKGKSVKTVRNAFYFLKAAIQFGYDNGMIEDKLDLCEVKVKSLD